MLWLILGLIIGVGGWWFVAWIKARQIRLTWYEWLLAALGVIFALLAIQNFTASFAELEPQAAWILLALFGVPAVIFGVAAWFLVWRRQKQVQAPAPVKA